MTPDLDFRSPDAEPLPAARVAEVATLIRTVTDALNRLEDLDVDVQMPATFNAGGSRIDAGTITFEDYDDGRRLGAITSSVDGWTDAPKAAQNDDQPISCRRMETRTCPESYNGPCGDRPCARFESDDPSPWMADGSAPR